MIASIQGKLIAKGDDHIVISINGLGFQMFTPTEIREKSNIGDTVFLYSQLIVRENFTIFIWV